MRLKYLKSIIFVIKIFVIKIFVIKIFVIKITAIKIFGINILSAYYENYAHGILTRPENQHDKGDLFKVQTAYKSSHKC